MPIAITDDHLALADTVAAFLTKNGSLAAARATLTAETATNPAFYAEAAALGWLGLAVSEANGGSGYGLAEAAVVAEQLGRQLAPGAFIPSMIAATVIDRSGSAAAGTWLGRLVNGTASAAVGLDPGFSAAGDTVSGRAVVLGAGLADVLVVAVGDDVAVIDAAAAGVEIDHPKNADTGRPSGHVALTGAAALILPGGRQALLDTARLLLSAEAVGMARVCTEQAADYARSRQQFGRVIGTYQAVKHHCANMLVAAEMATAAVWDAGRADSEGTQFSMAAAIAATKAIPAAYLCANLNTQVHGGIGFTWEHDAHLFMRRAITLRSLLDPNISSAAVTDLARAGVSRQAKLELPPEAEAFRDEVRAFAAEVCALAEGDRKEKLIDAGYAMPHWPKPWGRGAGAIEQLVIEEEFAAAGVKRPSYGITGWVILTLIQHANDDQVARWVRSALDHSVIWCQLFSEPDAGSDAAGITTKATRVDGGWLVNGQKVWTSQAHVAGKGLATVRTNPDVPKHSGITTMVIDMDAPGVETRRLKMPTGESEFNEVFFNDVFVPDDDVVGPIDGGWTVARATLGNESVSIGGGVGGTFIPGAQLIPMLDANPGRVPDGAQRIGTMIADQHSMAMLNLRSASRAVAGAGPGPEGAVTKLVIAEIGHDFAALSASLLGAETAFLDGPGALASLINLGHRGMSIAGGTSEIKRNQIGERILGLPRDPLIK